MKRSSAVSVRAARAVVRPCATTFAVAGSDELGVGGQPSGDGVPEALGLLDPYDAHRRDGTEPRALDELLDRGPVPQSVGSRGDVDDEDDVGRAGLGGDGGQCLRQKRARPADTTTARAPTRLAPCAEPARVILRDA